jgi:transcription initiation factor TFIIB
MARRDRPHDESHRTDDRTFDEDERVTDEATTSGCPECDGRVITNTAETVCTECGLVVDDQQIDHGPEWRCADDTDEVVRRTGAPRTEARHDDGLLTEIGHDRVEGSGQKQAQLARLRTQHNRTRFRSKRERNCATGLTEIRRIAANQAITRGTRDRACRLFRRAQDDDELQGRSIETVAAGAVYAACRLRGEVRTLAEVAEPARCSTQKVRLGYQILCRAYGLPVEPYPLDAWVDRVASACDLGPRARKGAQELASVAVEADITSGCQRGGVAAACVYEAAQAHPPTTRQVDVADAAETTAATLRARRQELLAALAAGDEHEWCDGVEPEASV